MTFLYLPSAINGRTRQYTLFQLLLIRHAQSANNALPEEHRVPDPGLTAIGHLQASALADWLARYQPTSLLCSGFSRALQTTRPVAEKLRLRPSVRYDLFEQGGCYSGYIPGQIKAFSGLGRHEIVSNYGDWEIDERISDHGWYHGRELEEDEQAIERAESVARWIVDELVPSGSDISTLNRPALIIHADFKALLLEALLKHSNSSLAWPSQRDHFAEFWNASVTQLTWVGTSWRLDFWNSIGHLPTEYFSH